MEQQPANDAGSAAAPDILATWKTNIDTALQALTAPPADLKKAVQDLWSEISKAWELIITEVADIPSPSDGEAKKARVQAMQALLQDIQRVTLPAVKAALTSLQTSTNNNAPQESLQKIKAMQVQFQAIHSHVSAALGTGSTDPTANKIQSSTILLQFPGRLFTPNMYAGNKNIVPSVFNMWRLINPKDQQREAKTYVDWSTIRRACPDNAYQDPVDLMNQYIHQWMQTYLVPDQDPIENYIHHMLLRPSSTRNDDEDEDNQGTKVKWLVLHGGYLLNISPQRILVRMGRRREQNRGGLKFILRMFH